MLRTGRVISAENGQVEVCFERPEACMHCNACSGQKHHTLVKMAGDAPVGSFVDVEMPQGQVLKASTLAYVVPMLLLILGIFIGMLIFKSDLAAAVIGIVMMALSYLLLRLFEKKFKNSAQWQPHITAVRAEGEKTDGTENQ